MNRETKSKSEAPKESAKESPRESKGEKLHFQELLTAKGLKLTFEREQLLGEIQRLKGHFDADSLYERLKAEGVRISRDTVYRTIPLLLECGIIQKSVGEGRREYFERPGTGGHHDHMVCLECGKVIEFHSDRLEELQAALCAAHGFELRFHDHRLFGRCRECSAAKKNV